MNADSVRALLAAAESGLARSASARLDAELLLQDVLGRDRAWLHAHPEQTVEPGAAGDFRRLVAVRAGGYPIAYLLGRREFWSLPLAVNAHTLIPRPETELLVETGLRAIADRVQPRVLDLGTGSGAIALAIASERADARVLAVDVCTQALAVARANAAQLGLDAVEFRRSDWFDALGGERYDLVLCNPPYVASGDPALVHSDIRYEPRLALDGGAGGLEALGRVIAAAGRHLAAGAVLVLEHGHDQAAPVAALLHGAGFRATGSARDLAGFERVSFGRWK